jgi:hypothetical protein
MGFLHFLLNKLDGEDLLLVLMVARLLWLRNNNVVFNRGFSAPGQVVVAAQQEVSEFLQANSTLGDIDSRDSHRESVSRLMAPP